MKDFKKKNAIGYNLKKRYYIYRRFTGVGRQAFGELADLGRGV